MAGTSVELKASTFNCIRSLILLLLVQIVISAAQELNANSYNIFRNIQDNTVSLRHKLLDKENKTMVMLRNLSDYVLNGIVDSKRDVDKLYKLINEYENENLKSDLPQIRINSSTCIEKSPNITSSINECVYAIREKDFDKAVETFNEINDNNEIFTIVKEIFKYEGPNSFNLLLKFSDKLSDSRSKFLVYKFLVNNELYSEMGGMENNYGLKFLTLIENLNNEMLRKNSDQLTREDSSDLLETLRTKTKQAGINVLRNLFVHKNSTDLKSGDEFLNRTYFSDESLFEEIHKEFLSLMKLNDMYSDVYGRLQVLTKSRRIPEQDLLLLTLNMFITKEFDQANVSKMQTMINNWRNIEMEYKNQIGKETLERYSDKVKKLLPLSMYNLFHAKRHCIRNVGLNEYLNTGHGSIPFYLHDKERRNVYTSAKNSSDGFGVWQITQSYGRYYIKSVNFNEYMYTTVETFISNRHVVWMWIPKDALDSYYPYIFEPSGDYVYIKSQKFNEYLFGSSRTDSSVQGWKRGHVYTLRYGNNDCPNQYCLWSIEDCTNVNADVLDVI